jgi:hypothetical protein
MVYVKPEVLAQNAAHGLFAAGCPTVTHGGGDCDRCELRN